MTRAPKGAASVPADSARAGAAPRRRDPGVGLPRPLRPGARVLVDRRRGYGRCFPNDGVWLMGVSYLQREIRGAKVPPPGAIIPPPRKRHGHSPGCLPGRAHALPLKPRLSPRRQRRPPAYLTTQVLPRLARSNVQSQRRPDRRQRGPEDRRRLADGVSHRNDYGRQDERRIICHPVRASDGELPLEAKMTFCARVGVRRDGRQEQRAPDNRSSCRFCQ
jgi:hypothetical protein